MHFQVQARKSKKTHPEKIFLIFKEKKLARSKIRKFLIFPEIEFSRNWIFLTIWKNTKQKRFRRTASCLNQNMISRTRYESKNLAIFRHNICIINFKIR